MSLTPEQLERALARQDADTKLSGPLTLRVHQALLSGEPLPEIPESPSEVPSCWPYKGLREAKKLLFLMESADGERGDEIAALFVARMVDDVGISAL